MPSKNDPKAVLPKPRGTQTKTARNQADDPAMIPINTSVPFPFHNTNPILQDRYSDLEYLSVQNESQFNPSPPVEGSSLFSRLVVRSRTRLGPRRGCLRPRCCPSLWPHSS